MESQLVFTSVSASATLVRGSRFSVCHLDFGGCVAAWRKFRKFRKCPICCGRNIRAVRAVWAVRAAISSAVELVFLITFHCPNGTLVFRAIALLLVRGLHCELESDSGHVLWLSSYGMVTNSIRGLLGAFLEETSPSRPLELPQRKQTQLQRRARPGHLYPCHSVLEIGVG